MSVKQNLYVVMATYLVPEQGSVTIPASSEDEAEKVARDYLKGYHNVDVILVTNMSNIQLPADIDGKAVTVEDVSPPSPDNVIKFPGSS